MLIAGCSDDSTGPDRNPQPSGTIVFSSDRGGNNDIYSMAADGSSVQKLTASLEQDGESDISADGTRTATTTRSGRWTSTVGTCSG
jgi:Tol biopolymer transport system component